MKIVKKIRNVVRRWRTAVRDATTGRFVSKDRAKADPAGTVTERFRIDQEG